MSYFLVTRKKYLQATLIFCACLGSLNISYAQSIHVDGIADEVQWKKARNISDFRVTQPFTLAQPLHATKVKLLSTPEGIAVSFYCEQPASTVRQKNVTARDADIGGDRVNVYLDLDADGRTAYVFTLGLSGSIQDATMTQDGQYKTDWDGDWKYAVHETEQSWSAEILIPWTIASMRDSTTKRRTIGVLFDRMIGATQERSASSASSFERPQFLASFQRIEIAQYSQSQLNVFPYLTVASDQVSEELSLKTGADIFWKPVGDFQLTAALNPDFGQVEADELVVNFDAVESFFSDKRPFFTENQSLFELNTPGGGSLLYTRRIGGASDRDRNQAAEIDAAVKLNGAHRGVNYGVLAASEADYVDDLESAFLAQRLLYPTDTYSIGYFGTWADRPFFDRQAVVNAVDMNWRPSTTTQLAGQIILSDVDQGEQSSSGMGAWTRLELAPTQSWTHELELLHFDRHFDINDMGFLRRNSLNEAQWKSEWIDNNFDPASSIRNASWEGEVEVGYNDSGEKLPGEIKLEQTTRYKSGSQNRFELAVNTSGVDDLISRGNGRLFIDQRAEAYWSYVAARRGDWLLASTLAYIEHGLNSASQFWTGQATYFVDENLTIDARINPRVTENWTLWRSGTLFGQYDRKQVQASMNVNWFPRPSHEFRVKAQWVGIEATVRNAYRLGGDGNLHESADILRDFTVNNLGLQLRYRWEFAPQSDLFVVYNRGGFIREEGEVETLGNLLSEALELRDVDQIVVKARYRF